MSVQKFSKKEALAFGWNTVMNNFLFFLGLLVIWGVISFLFNIAAKELEEIAPAFSFLISIVGFVVGAIINMGMLYIMLRFADNIKPSYADLLAPAKQIQRITSFILGSIFYGLIVLAGFILLIIPGIIWSIKYGLFRYAIVDEGLGPIEALKRSAMLTQGSKWNLFLLGLLLGLINILGVLAFGFGLLITIPLSMVAGAYVYRKLLASSGKSEAG